MVTSLPLNWSNLLQARFAGPFLFRKGHRRLAFALSATP